MLFSVVDVESFEVHDSKKCSMSVATLGTNPHHSYVHQPVELRIFAKSGFTGSSKSIN